MLRRRFRFFATRRRDGKKRKQCDCRNQKRRCIDSKGKRCATQADKDPTEGRTCHAPELRAQAIDGIRTGEIFLWNHLWDECLQGGCEKRICKAEEQTA